MTALLATGSTRRWRRIRLYVLDRDGWRCQLPSDDDPAQLCLDLAEHVDHIVARVDGGSDDPANLRAACAFHNLRRGRGATPGLPVGKSRPSRQVSRWSW